MAASPPVCEFGLPAVDFSLPATDGKTYSLADIKGEKATLVMFICNHCPYVKAVIKRIVRDVNDLKEFGVKAVAISANDAEKYPEDSFENMKKFASEHNLNFPYLYDKEQKIAKEFGAVCTPDFFGYNKLMQLQYRGRLDASRKEAAADDAKRDLFAAMKQIAQCGHGSKEQIASIGCSIKWL